MMQGGRFKMLENEEGTVRYEFYTSPLYKSNVDDTVVEWQPTIQYCRKLTLGSTMSFERVAGRTHEERVQRGNAFYKELLAKGFRVVTERSFA